MSTNARFHFLSKLSLALISTLAGLFMLELISMKLLSGPHFKYSASVLRYSSPLNSLGFRDFEYADSKEEKHFRIIAVGDSFTYGAGVNFDDAYPKRLERYLNYFLKDSGKVYQVMNMGRSRRSTPEEVKMIRKMADKMKPDLVILGYCLNDAEDWDKPDQVDILRGKHYYYHFSEPKGFKGYLYRHSALARLIVQRVFNTLTYRGHKQYYLDLYRENYSGWKKTKKALMELGEFSRTREIPVVVFIFPISAFGLGDDYPFGIVHEQLSNVMKEAGLYHMDLLPFYLNEDRIRLESIPDKDHHPSEIAHRIATEELFRFLMKKGLLPVHKKFRNLWKNGEILLSPF